jgi:hypothetical protein
MTGRPFRRMARYHFMYSLDEWRLPRAGRGGMAAGFFMRWVLAPAPMCVKRIFTGRAGNRTAGQAFIFRRRRKVLIYKVIERVKKDFTQKSGAIWSHGVLKKNIFYG